MPYVVSRRVRPGYQITFDDLFDPNFRLDRMNFSDTPHTATFYREFLPKEFIDQYDIDGMIYDLENFNRQTATLHSVPREKLYRSYKIPKRSGGFRQIDEPLPTLMAALEQLKNIFEYRCFALYHTAAYAYVRHRCNVDMARYHQHCNSNWFAHFDFSNFFGSVTHEFVMRILSEIFPFSEICKRNRDALDRAVELCFLDGGLPQGTPISPMLTNIIMIPLDAAIAKRCRNGNLHYTRYADDIYVSGYRKFDPQEVERNIEDVLHKWKAPMQINKKKSTFGSRAGHNMICGVILTPDNRLSIGYKKRNQYRALVFNFLTSYQDKQPWSLADTQYIQGLTAAYRSVNRENTDSIIKSYNTKFGLDFDECCKIIIKNGGSV